MLDSPGIFRSGKYGQSEELVYSPKDSGPLVLPKLVFPGGNDLLAAGFRIDSPNTRFYRINVSSHEAVDLGEVATGKLAVAAVEIVGGHCPSATCRCILHAQIAVSATVSTVVNSERRRSTHCWANTVLTKYVHHGDPLFLGKISLVARIAGEETVDNLDFMHQSLHNSPEVLVLYRKRSEVWGVRKLGVIARFRYNDLKEAAVFAAERGPYGN